MLVLDSYVLFDKKSIVIVYFRLAFIFDVINDHDSIQIYTHVGLKL